MACRPPSGTKEGTRHILKNDGTSSEFEWTGRSWSTPGTGFGTKPGFMAALGWQYDEPAASEARQ